MICHSLGSYNTPFDLCMHTEVQLNMQITFMTTLLRLMGYGDTTETLGLNYFILLGSVLLRPALSCYHHHLPWITDAR